MKINDLSTAIQKNVLQKIPKDNLLKDGATSIEWLIGRRFNAKNHHKRTKQVLFHWFLLCIFLRYIYFQNASFFES